MPQTIPCRCVPTHDLVATFNVLWNGSCHVHCLQMERLESFRVSAREKFQALLLRKGIGMTQLFRSLVSGWLETDDHAEIEAQMFSRHEYYFISS